MLKLEIALEQYNMLTGNKAVIESVSQLKDEHGVTRYVFICGRYDDGKCKEINRIITYNINEAYAGHPRAIDEYDKALQDIDDAIKSYKERSSGVRGFFRSIFGF